MEIIGVAFGAASLVGLYSACLEAVDRVASYRHFGSDKKQLLTQIDANKDILQKWAKRVGMSAEGLANPHDPRLDDFKTAEAVSEIFTCIRDIFVDPSKAKYRRSQNEPRDFLAAPSRFCEPSVINGSQAPSRKRDRWAWTLYGKRKLESQVIKFTRLVKFLDRLVPSLGSSDDGKELSQQFHLMNFKDISLLCDNDILRRLRDQDRKEVLTWLSPVQPNGRYEACRARHTPGTCSWIFNKQVYREWKSPQIPGDTAKLLWLHGPAGFGKSYLCAAIVESLEQEEGQRLNHYFCTSTSISQDNPSAILKSWILQLINRDDELLDLAYEEVRRSSSQASNPSLWSLFRRLNEDTSGCIYVVDGLDECGVSSGVRQEYVTEDRRTFLEQLLHNVENTDCRVLIVSRDEADIRSQLSSRGPQKASCIFHEYEILRTDIDTDVLAFAQNLVKKILHNKSDADQTEIAEQMAEKSDGMFLWVDLQGRQLSGGKSKRKLLQIVQAMPKELGSVYRKSLVTILSRPPDEKSRALDILRWAMFATRPLTVSEITEVLLSRDLTDGKDLLLDGMPDRYDLEYLYDRITDLCASLVEVREISGEQIESWTVHLRHFSIREFLLTTDACEALSDPVFTAKFDQVIQHKNLVKICRRYQQLDRITEGGANVVQQSSFYEYAIQLWHRYLSQIKNRYSILIKSMWKPQ